MAKDTKGKDTKKRTRPAPAPAPETTEEHMRRLGCFSPGEVVALLKVEVSHEHIDQLARDKGVGIELSAQAEAEAEAIIDKGVPAPSRGEDVSENEDSEGQAEASPASLIEGVEPGN